MNLSLLALLLACRSDPKAAGDDTAGGPTTTADDTGTSACEPVPWYQDADGDGVGSAEVVAIACEGETGWAATTGDCDDGDATVQAPFTRYLDGDGDGYGDPAGPTTLCEEVEGLLADDTDCDDQDETVHPGAEEVCDGVDQDCDLEVDEDAVDQAPWYTDADGDGFGAGDAATGCDPGLGFSGQDGDCDDGAAGIHPDAVEICDDGLDQDCSGRADNTCPVVSSFPEHERFLLHGAADRSSGDDGPGSSNALGDLDGDGEVDLAVADEEYDGERGRILLARGPFTGDAWADDLDGIEGRVGSSTRLGARVTVLPDLDGDGRDELAGLAEWEPSTDGRAYGGALFVWTDAFGAAGLGEGALDEADLVIRAGPYDGIHTFADRVAHGDLDGDGDPDLVLTSRQYGTELYEDNVGAALIFPADLAGEKSTEDAVRIEGAVLDAAFAEHLATGDLDGDGVDDLALSDEQTLVGAVHLFFGPITADLGAADADLVLGSSLLADAFGSGLDTGDLDGDGHRELLVGASETDHGGDAYAGAVHTFPGSSAGPGAEATFTLYGEACSLGSQGQGVHATDLDGDGRADLVAGARDYEVADLTNGAIFIVYGPASGTRTTESVDRRLEVEADYDGAGDGAAMWTDGASVLWALGMPDWSEGGPPNDPTWQGGARVLELPGD